MATQLRILSVYSQPKSSSAKWKSRGINTLFRYEPENDSKGNPTVSMADWKSAARLAGLNYICQPSNTPAADAQDPNLTAFLLSPDEPDDAIVGGQAGLIQSLLSQYKSLKTLAPNVPVVINIDLWQTQWGKVDYASLLSACDWVSGDYYPCNRGDTDLTIFSQRLNWLKQIAGSKRIIACLECSNQQLDKTYFPSGHGPSAQDMKEQNNLLLTNGIDICWFPQQINGQGNGFSYDATTPDTVAALIAINTGSPVVTPVTPTPVPTPTPVVPISPTLLKQLTVSVYSDGSVIVK